MDAFIPLYVPGAVVRCGHAGVVSRPLLRLLGVPDGLSGDAEGPRHRGLGLPALAQQPDGGGLIGG